MTVAWILGQGGLFGSALKRTLEARDTEIFTPSEPLCWDNPQKIQVQCADAIREFAAKAKTADAWQIHWAAGRGMMASTEEELRKETDILNRLLTCTEKHDALLTMPGAITFASSAGAIYSQTRDDVITEDAPVSPATAYGREKIIQEELLHDFQRRHPSTKVLIARLSNLYGAGQATTKKHGLLTHIARCILRRTPINIFVPFDTIRDYITADDAAAITMKALKRMTNAGVVTKIVASEEPTTVASIIGTFKRISRVSPLIITSAHPLGSSYPHRIRFRSTVLKGAEHPTTPLLIGIAKLLEAERLALMR